MAVMLGRNRYAAAFVVTKFDETGDLDRRTSVRLRYDEDALGRVLGAGEWVFRSWVEPDGSSEVAVVDPSPHYELVLVLDARVDEEEEKPRSMPS